MTGDEHLTDDGRTTGDGRTPGDDVAEVEQELRVLLHRAAPELPAPADRMARILDRADRTRRRRRSAALTAGLTAGLAAAVLVAAPAIAPTPGPAVGPAAGPAAGPTGVTGPPAPTPTPEVGADPARPVRFPDLGGVVLDLPANWYAIAAPSYDPMNSLGHLSTQALTAKATCPPPTGEPKSPLAVCTPTGELDSGGVLITLMLTTSSAGPEASAGPEQLTEQPLGLVCQARGGTLSLEGERTGIAKGVVLLEACLREPDQRTIEQVRRLLASLRPAGLQGGASAEPTEPAAPGSSRR
ncbi:hypothetical protein ACWEQL_34935 [Kitasatospora sp. NPDC004240]